MRPTFNIRPARVEEATALSDLCFRSKAVWGYDAGFMTLMPAALEVAPKEIAAGDVWITTGTDGQIAGVVALAPGEGRWPINPGLKQTKRDAIQSLQRRLIGINKGIRPAPALDTD
jgi:hypothetical protein